MKGFLVVLIGLASAGAATAEDASAPCVPPPAVPAPYVFPDIIAIPVLPGCINPKTHMSTCSPKVLKAYNDAVDAHNRDVMRVSNDARTYVDQVNDYTRAASRYGLCLIDQLNGEANKRLNGQTPQ